MSNQPRVNTYANLRTLTRKLRSDLEGVSILLIYAYNRTGKTRLSMKFKDEGKRKNRGAPDTLYFNAFTEDLFTWENDLEGDNTRLLQINHRSKFFDALTELALDDTIYGYLSRYTDFEFDLHIYERADYAGWCKREDREDNGATREQFEEQILGRPSHVSFVKDNSENIKISRGEEKIFIWCLFMAICERMLDGHESYQWADYLFIDDPISSLDDNNAIAIACDLAKLLRRAANRTDSAGDHAPLKIVFSSHHSLFFNVMCNELGRAKEGEPRVRHKRYFLHRPNSEGRYALRSTEDTPYFHHVASLTELKRAADPDTGTLYTFHFNALRSIMEKTASFFGHPDISFCLKALNNEENEALFNRALNLLSHGKYAIQEPTLMGEDNQNLFRQILTDFIDEFKFQLPDILGTSAN